MLLCYEVEHLIDTVDIRFKGNGLESVEVQDNGAGISSDNYETVGKSIRSCGATFSSLNPVSSIETLYVETCKLRRPYSLADVWLPRRGFIFALCALQFSYSNGTCRRCPKRHEA